MALPAGEDYQAKDVNDDDDPFRIDYKDDMSFFNDLSKVQTKRKAFSPLSISVSDEGERRAARPHDRRGGQHPQRQLH